MPISTSGNKNVSVNWTREEYVKAVKRFTPPVVLRMYKAGIPSHVIAQALGISSKTVIKIVDMATNGHGVRGRDPYTRKQTYSWTKTVFGRLSKWRIAGKITSKVMDIARAFFAWVVHYLRFGEFDLDSVLAGERPP